MRRLVPIVLVSLVSLTALADSRSERADRLATRGGLGAALADSIHVRGLLFRDLACAQFSHPQDVRGADRDKLADCLVALRPMRSDMATDAFVALALHLEVFDQNGTHIAGRELIALQLRGDRVVAIGGATAARGRDADLATYQQINSEQVEPTPAAKAAIDKSGHDAVTWMKLCHDAAGAITSRAIVAPSGIKVYDDQVLAHYASITQLPPIELGGDAIAACQLRYVPSAVPPPPPPPPAPVLAPPTAIEKLRIGGTREIAPDATTRQRIIAAKRDRVIGSLKLCLDATGAVEIVKLLKSTGFDAYDAELVAGMRAWGFKPYLVDGNPTPVCTAATFIYSP